MNLYAVSGRMPERDGRWSPVWELLRNSLAGADFHNHGTFGIYGSYGNLTTHPSIHRGPSPRLAAGLRDLNHSAPAVAGAE